MHYYDADGKKVKEGDASATRQYLSDDPSRPDAKPAEDQAVKSVDVPSENKAVSSPTEKK